jgi:hydrogenase expression/formation protein HypE
MQISLAHGSGGNATRELINEIFQKHFSNEILNQMEDSAVLTVPTGKIAFTTDSFVVQPLFFKGGDIGKLAVCGTVNDLLMQGAVPKYLSAGFILEEGLLLDDLTKIVISMKEAATQANVKIVTGDTKVVEGHGGIYINTSGIGFIEDSVSISSKSVKLGDTVIVSGNLGNHHACILSHRMKIENNIYSDCAPLTDMVQNLIAGGIKIRSMRDITRGGLATVLNEIADSCGQHINLIDAKIPVDQEVQAFSNILGLDPLYMANEGKFMVIVDPSDANRAVEILRKSKYGENTAIVGTVEAVESCQSNGETNQSPGVTLTTKLGGKRIIDILYGEGLPRIC